MASNLASETSVTPLEFGLIADIEYDCFICALGYETRSRWIAENAHAHAARSIAVGFSEHKELAFDKNREFFLDNAFEIAEAANNHVFAAFVDSALVKIARIEQKPLRLLFDVSSQTRSRIAHVLSICRAIATHRTIEIDIAYAVAAFSLSDRDEMPMRHLAPVSADFSGCSLDPERPPAAVVGLGFELDRALGAIEYLQADENWIFLPTSPIREYEREVRKANEILIENTRATRITNYNVLDPFETFGLLESLVYGLQRDSRPILIPFGPKIFSVVSMLVALKHDVASVWRISSGEPDSPADRRGSGYACALRILMNPETQNASNQDST